MFVAIIGNTAAMLAPAATMDAEKDIAAIIKKCDNIKAYLNIPAAVADSLLKGLNLSENKKRKG